MARNKSVIQVVVTGEASRLQKAMSGAGSMIANFGAALVTLGIQAAKAAVAVGALAVRQFANFDAAMTQSLAIMGDVSDAMRKDMSDAAREVAKTTLFSAEQAANAYFYLASAGFDAEQSIAALPKVAAFAQAGMFDLSTATDLLTDAQSALGMKSDDTAESIANMTRIGDVLVKANTLANASVQEFSEALTNKAGAALKVFGKDVEEGVAALALLADNGAKGAEAGEKLNVMLRDVTRAAAKAPEKFAALGLSVLDSEGNLKNLADVTDEFTRVLGDMSDGTLSATLDQLGLTRSVGDVIKLMMGGGDAIRDYEAALRDAGGTTEDVAAKQLDTLKNQAALLRSQFADVLLGIGERIAPIVGGIVESLAENMPAIEAAIGRAMDVFDERVVPVLQAVADFIVNNVGPAFVTFGGFIREEVVPAVQQMVSWIEDHLVPPIQTLVAFIVEHVLPALQGIGTFIMDYIVPAIQNFFEPVLAAFTAGLETLSEKLGDNSGKFKALLSALEPLARFVRDVVAPVFGAVFGGALRVVAWILGLVIDAIGSISSVIASVIGPLLELTELFVTLGREIIQGLIRGVKEMADRLIDAVKGVVKDAISAAKKLLGISSPSRVFEGFGKDSIRGFIKGFEGMSPKVEATVVSGLSVAGLTVSDGRLSASAFELPDLSGRGRGGNIVINVSGAIDPEGTARTIRRVLQDAERRSGVRL